MQVAIEGDFSQVQERPKRIQSISETLGRDLKGFGKYEVSSSV